MKHSGKGRGRPKKSFDPYLAEHNRRREAGIANPILEQEARELEKWYNQTIELGLKHPAIRNRLKKRFPNYKEQILDLIAERSDDVAE